MKTVTEVDIDGTVVEIKSKRDDRHPSGWSVIAFTPEVSIRSVKCHRQEARAAFADAIVSSIVGSVPDAPTATVNQWCMDTEAAIKSIID